MRSVLETTVVTVLVLLLLAACQEDRKPESMDRLLEGRWKSACVEETEVVGLNVFSQEFLLFGDGRYRYSVKPYEDSNCVTELTGVPFAPRYDNLFGEYRLVNNEQSTLVTPSGLTAHRIHFDRADSGEVISNIIGIIDGTLYLGTSFQNSVEAPQVASDLDLTGGYTR